MTTMKSRDHHGRRPWRDYGWLGDDNGDDHDDDDNDETYDDDDNENENDDDDDGEHDDN